MRTDEDFMRKAICLAKRAEGLTNPNPTVGAVIVRGQSVVGAGYHKACGMAHAEINALRKAGNKARGATLYVTLEPCDHYGRTPPCTDAIIESGIRRVVIGTIDPNPINSGKGVGKLKRYGLKTAVGVLEDEARSMNAPYFKYITERMPYITVKVAQSIDGKIATRTGDSKWISNERSRRYVHGLRARVDAVMVGANTVLKDDPLLMSGASVKKQPVRIIVDTRLKTPTGSRVFSRMDRSPVIIATAADITSKKVMRYKKTGAIIMRIRRKNGRIDLKHLMKDLAKAGIMHVLVEGGGELIAGLVEVGLVDRLLCFIAPKIIGGKDAITSVEGSGAGTIDKAVSLKDVSVKRFCQDILIEADVDRCLPA